MNEFASTYARNMIEMLLHVHALTNMHLASGDDEYRKTASGWLDNIESQMKALRRELSPAAPSEHGGERG